VSTAHTRGWSTCLLTSGPEAQLCEGVLPHAGTSLLTEPKENAYVQSRVFLTSPANVHRRRGTSLTCGEMTKRARRPAEAEAEAEAPVAVTVANEHLEDVHVEEDEAPVAATPRKKAAPRITKKAASTAKKGATAKDDSSARGAAKRTRLTKLADWEEGAAQVAVTVADEHLADSKDEDAVVVSEQLGKVKEEEPVAAPVVRRIPKRNISSAARTAAAEKDAEREATAIRAKQEHETALAAAPITADDLPAAFNPPNVNQVYLRRAVLEEIATRPKVNQVRLLSGNLASSPSMPRRSKP
jgi:hypothetical protein